MHWQLSRPVSLPLKPVPSWRQGRGSHPLRQSPAAALVVQPAGRNTRKEKERVTKLHLPTWAAKPKQTSEAQRRHAARRSGSGQGCSKKKWTGMQQEKVEVDRDAARRSGQACSKDTWKWTWMEPSCCPSCAACMMHQSKALKVRHRHE
eukprot:1156331-Pelagomonas_calceolata.AAC.5